MGNEKGEGEGEASHTHFGSIPTSYVQLLIDNIDSHPVLQNLQNLELGKLVFPVATTTAVGLLVFHGCLCCPVEWDVIGEDASSSRKYSPTPSYNSHLVLALCPYGIIAYSWLSATLFLLPLLYILVAATIKPQAGGDSEIMVDA